MTDFQDASLLFTALIVAHLLGIYFLSHRQSTLIKRACFYKHDLGDAFYLEEFSRKDGRLTYAFTGRSSGTTFFHGIKSQHMKLLIDKIRTLRDDIDTGAYYVGNPYRATLGGPEGHPALFGRKYTVFKRYGFVGYLSPENEQRYHAYLFDIFICDEAAGHFCLFKLHGDPEFVRLIRLSLADVRKLCDEVLGTFAADFAEA